MSKSKVLVIVTGSIAAYKACQVISRLAQSQSEVKVVATSAALEFVGQATLEGLTGNKVHHELYEEGQMMGHINLQRWADLIVVLPATANYINKISNGIGDDLASTLFLAHDFKKPFLISPAMNTKMYTHPLTQKSIQNLKSLGVVILETASGVLACGETGFGKLLDPDLILQEILQRLEVKLSPQPTVQNPAKSKALRVFITAGGTSEAIDSVRSITNLSTGKTGFNLAKNLSQFGYNVTLALSENSKFDSQNEDFKMLRFSDFTSLQNLVNTQMKNHEYDVVFHLAAVSDYSIDSIKVDGKIQNSKKIPSGAELVLTLKPNPKIVDSIKSDSLNANVKLIAFKLTSAATQSEIESAVEKLMKSSTCEYVVQNDTNQFSKNKDRHLFTIFKRVSGKPEKLFEASNVNALTEYFAQELL